MLGTSMDKISVDLYFSMHNRIEEHMSHIVKCKSAIDYDGEHFSITGFDLIAENMIQINLETWSSWHGTQCSAMIVSSDLFYADSQSMKELEEKASDQKRLKDEAKRQAEIDEIKKNEESEKEQLRILKEKYK
jgi:hypothetical protein